MQFKGALAVKEKGNLFTKAFDAIAHFYLTMIKGFDMDKVAGCTLMFEGTREEVKL